ncbi:lipid asymmetry maintenance protein MlaB [Alysiella sp.]|uniref:STAS domain-containing protein n=1 Tax=Alysiella sp. TaxID=1872483 RepID=UPI0026DD3EB9|nr:STAS domain-containing protein [Alysiella sp.]
MQIEIQEHRLCIHGEVSVRTLTAATYKRFEKDCCRPEIHIIDFSGVTRVDSACLSLLLTVIKKRPGSLKIHALPQSVLDLAALYEIQEWLLPTEIHHQAV